MDKATDILALFQVDEEKAFRLLFDTYYDSLVLYANQILNDSEASKDIVQECFVDFFVNKRFLKLPNGLDRYIFQSVKHATLNYLRDQRRRNQRHMASLEKEEKDISINIENNELQEIELLYHAINQLPGERRKIFLMICAEGMKYQEVADTLGISINTVRTQITRSIKALRNSLDESSFTEILFLLFKKSRLPVT